MTMCKKPRVADFTSDERGPKKVCPCVRPSNKSGLKGARGDHVQAPIMNYGHCHCQRHNTANSEVLDNVEYVMYTAGGERWRVPS